MLLLFPLNLVTDLKEVIHHLLNNGNTNLYMLSVESKNLKFLRNKEKKDRLFY